MRSLLIATLSLALTPPSAGDLIPVVLPTLQQGIPALAPPGEEAEAAAGEEADQPHPPMTTRRQPSCLPSEPS